MSIDRARELLAVQVSFGGGYNRNAAKLILNEVAKDYSQNVVDQLIREFHLDKVFGFQPGTHFA